MNIHCSMATWRINAISYLMYVYACVRHGCVGNTQVYELSVSHCVGRSKGTTYTINLNNPQEVGLYLDNPLEVASGRREMHNSYRRKYTQQSYAYNYYLYTVKA